MNIKYKEQIVNLSAVYFNLNTWIKSYFDIDNSIVILSSC